MKKQQTKSPEELPKLSDSEEYRVAQSEERLAEEAHERALAAYREADADDFAYKMLRRFMGEE